MVPMELRPTAAVGEPALEGGLPVWPELRGKEGDVASTCALPLGQGRRSGSGCRGGRLGRSGKADVAAEWWEDKTFSWRGTRRTGRQQGAGGGLAVEGIWVASGSLVIGMAIGLMLTSREKGR